MERSTRRKGDDDDDERDEFRHAAREVLGLETLETRRARHLDFHELAVWQIREALRMAYSAGYEDAVGDAGA